MKTRIEVAAKAEALDQRMGKLGAELLLKATICAATMALIAGMIAALVGNNL